MWPVQFIAGRCACDLCRTVVKVFADSQHLQFHDCMHACEPVGCSQFSELHLQVTTADVIPPNFTAGTPLVSVVHETDFTMTVQLNKSSCTVYFSVMLYSTAQPTLESVLNGRAPGSLFNGTITAPVVRPFPNPTPSLGSSPQ